MRTISLSAKFKRDYKRENKGRSAEDAEALGLEIERIVDDLTSDRSNYRYDISGFLTGIVFTGFIRDRPVKCADGPIAAPLQAS